MMFPKVTGMRLLNRKLPQLRLENFATASAAAAPLMKRQAGMKYMLAIECSNPEATKAEIGKMMAIILPAVLFAAIAIMTARSTRILQSIPRKKACPQVKPDFALAIDIACSPMGVSPVPARHKSVPRKIHARSSEPMKFAK